MPWKRRSSSSACPPRGAPSSTAGSTSTTGATAPPAAWRLRRILARSTPTPIRPGAFAARYQAPFGDQAGLRAALPDPVAKRPPSFCTGCPERPVFSAMKILKARDPSIGDTHVAHDIGCSTFSTQAPFNAGHAVLGYGIGLASGSAVGPLLGKRTIAVMGDGGL